MANLCNVDGVIGPEADGRVPVLDRGFLFGDSIYEVVRTHDGVPLAWIEHWARLEASAAGLGMALARLVAKRADRWIDRCFDLSLRTVDQRLARFLLELAPQDETVISYVIARERDVATIAALLGSVREEVTRAQRRLQEAGIIEVNRREVRVLDRAALADLLLD